MYELFGVGGIFLGAVLLLAGTLWLIRNACRTRRWLGVLLALTMFPGTPLIYGLIRFRRNKRPLILVLAGIFIGAIPFTADRAYEFVFGPGERERVTYGAPMIGNQKASDAFNKEFKGQIFRYVSGRDPVPKLPGLSLVANEFTHVESARVLGTDPMTNLSEFAGAIGSQAVNGLLAGSLIDDVWKYVSEQVSAHFLDAYDGLLKK